ncbi:protein kinase [Streptomyces sp. M10(2022)]
MHRALCPVETLYVAQRSRGALLHPARTGGRGALSAAFDAVTQTSPTLRSRIAPDGRGFALHLLTESERPRLITRTGHEDARRAELNAPLPVGATRPRGPGEHTGRRPPSVRPRRGPHDLRRAQHHRPAQHRLGALPGPGRGRRGRPGGRRGRRGPEGFRGRSRWPRPVSELLPDADPVAVAAYLERRVEETQRHPVQLLPYDVPRPAADGSEPTADGRIEVCRLTLDEERTDRLRRTAREAGLSVHSSSPPRCSRQHGDAWRATVPAPSAVCPRGSAIPAVPPLPAAVMVPAVTAHLQSVDVAGDTDPMVLARTVHTRLRDSIARADQENELRITTEVPGTRRCRRPP